MRTLALGGIAFLGFAADLGIAQTVSVERAPAVDRVNAEDLHRARHILGRFFRTERRTDCYFVLFSQFEGNLRVDFVPKNRDPVVVQESEAPSAAATPCGANVGYVLDRRGRILRRIYSR